MAVTWVAVHQYITFLWLINRPALAFLTTYIASISNINNNLQNKHHILLSAAATSWLILPVDKETQDHCAGTHHTPIVIRSTHFPAQQRPLQNYAPQAELYW